MALGVPKLGRYRINLYRQRGTAGVAVRSVRTHIPSFEELNLPEAIRKLCQQHRGLIVVTGTTGSGKSTTLAAMIEEINATRSENILTVEDPIEYVFRDRQSIISQREIGGDTESFATALRHAFRQDPDVILIGEIRDLETMMIALMAADTGHLVLTTLHTLNAIETISRIISFFPPHQHQEIRYLLASTLQAIISQRLIPDITGTRRYPAVEVMINTSTIREYIVDPEKTVLIRQAIQDGFVQYQMQTFDQALMSLYREKIISLEEALKASSNPHEFALRVKGIQASSDVSWDRFEAPAPAEPEPQFSRI